MKVVYTKYYFCVLVSITAIYEPGSAISYSDLPMDN